MLEIKIRCIFAYEIQTRSLDITKNKTVEKKIINFDDAVRPELIAKWEKLQKRYYNLFGTSRLYHYYKKVYDDDIDFDRDKIIDALMVDEKEAVESGSIDDIRFDIELVIKNLNK